MLDCNALQQELRAFDSCAQTPSGLRVTTDCLYPSFEQVCVYVIGHGDGYIVHDDAQAARVAWIHGSAKRTISSSILNAAASHGCDVGNHTQQIRLQVPTSEWLWSSIVSVANCSALAARKAIEGAPKSRELGLIRKTKKILDLASWHPETKLEVSYTGQSGKSHSFDLSVKFENKLALVDAVVPHPASIASKYLAFSDTENRVGLYKYAVFEGDLPQEDKALLSNVADVIDFKKLSSTDGRFLLN